MSNLDGAGFRNQEVVKGPMLSSLGLEFERGNIIPEIIRPNNVRGKIRSFWGETVKLQVIVKLVDTGHSLCSNTLQW